MNHSKYVIIVAGGSGSRMQSEIPKQFLLLNGKPVLMHTILRFAEAISNIQIILVLPEAQKAYWNDLCKAHNFTVNHKIITGGNSRFQSVSNGLASISEDTGLVAIHDGVRPLTHIATIQKGFKLAEEKGNSITAVPSKDSLRLVEQFKNQAVDRSLYFQIQTPQTFQVALIKKAFQQPESPLFTDDAAVLEKSGQQIYLCEGSYDNLKITTPEDLIIAEALQKAIGKNQ